MGFKSCDKDNKNKKRISRGRNDLEKEEMRHEDLRRKKAKGLWGVGRGLWGPHPIKWLLMGS